jgi:DNA-directed RNA polymerase subunit RPC12/RpoP
MMIGRLFDRINARCPRCRHRIPDMNAFHLATPKAPYACPACGAKLIPLLSGNPVFRAIKSHFSLLLLIEALLYEPTFAIGGIILLAILVYYFVEVAVVCAVLIGLSAVITRIWPAVMISGSGEAH